MNVFCESYAISYDALYRDKDYQTECDVLERLFKEFASSHVERVLDLGCGTGNHAIALAKRGYKVVGIDRSPFMLEKALKKARNLDAQFPKPNFQEGDISEISLPDTFDAVLLMFSVLGYQIGNEKVLATLGNARRHLHSGGLLVFDVWYGPAVLDQGPSDRLRIIRNKKRTILRVASGELDLHRQICNVNYRLWEIRDDKLVAETKENHPVRFFFPQELELFLSATGFKLCRLGAFPEFDRDPDQTTWNVLALAEAVCPERSQR